MRSRTLSPDRAEVLSLRRSLHLALKDVAAVSLSRAKWRSTAMRLRDEKASLEATDELSGLTPQQRAAHVQELEDALVTQSDKIGELNARAKTLEEGDTFKARSLQREIDAKVAAQARAAVLDGALDQARAQVASLDLRVKSLEGERDSLRRGLEREEARVGDLEKQLAAFPSRPTSALLDDEGNGLPCGPLPSFLDDPTRPT